MQKSELQAVLAGSGQEHILGAYDVLNPDERKELAKEITSSGLDFKHLNVVLKESLALLDSATAQATTIEPPPASALFDVNALRHSQPDLLRQIRLKGLEAVAQGKTAVLLLAGGSGTRLGVTIPKGLFTCERLRESKSLFEVHCEKVVRIQQLASEAFPATPSGKITVLVMTSEQNDTETREFFAAHMFFGLDAGQVHFFRQSSLPCYDEATGRILMASPYNMCMAPGGNGGVYQCLAQAQDGATETVLDMLKRTGVEYVQTFNVDNLLARIADPLFYGYAITEGAHVTVKTTPKVGPDERVGVFARTDGQWGVVEYTEIGPERAAERDPATGELRYNCGNIACHLLTVEFLALAAGKMRTTTLYHAARKKLPTIDGPKMAVKLEAFIFDMFRYCGELPRKKNAVAAADDAAAAPNADDQGFRIMQVDRSEEFAPIKNADGAATDTPTTAAKLVLTLHTRWAEELLSSPPASHPHAKSTPEQCAAALEKLRSGARLVEISPLASAQGEALEPYLDFLVDQLLHGTHEIVLVERTDASTVAKI